MKSEYFRFVDIFYLNRPLYKERVLELNASDERGIEVIRQKVKSFAHVVVSGGNTGTNGARPPPPYKLIVLDEADSMTAPAQVRFSTLFFIFSLRFGSILPFLTYNIPYNTSGHSPIFVLNITSFTLRLYNVRFRCRIQTRGF